ncbi:MAG: nucleotidyl transferase AbiEii/AbiGii toxin family protein [Rhizobacter sp.]|nr:nucleotidyl transferase AbiEii/AbiGii toxin family protein [Chlorobiales bacterium]
MTDNQLEQTLADIHRICEVHQLRYAVIGGVALMAYFEQRTTSDIDLTIGIEFGNLEKIYDAFTTEFAPIKDDALNFFNAYFVLPLRHRKNDLTIDISAGVSGFERTVIKRRKKKKFGNATIYIASLEDLLIYKLIADREKDKIDLENLASQTRYRLDKTYLLKTAKLFAESGIDIELGAKQILEHRPSK